MLKDFLLDPDIKIHLSIYTIIFSKLFCKYYLHHIHILIVSYDFAYGDQFSIIIYRKYKDYISGCSLLKVSENSLSYKYLDVCVNDDNSNTFLNCST